MIQLNDLNVSVNFYKFLAFNASDNYGGLEFATLPFIDSEGNVINSFHDKLVFYGNNRKKDKSILKEKWFNSSWAYFINDFYTEGEEGERVWKFFLNEKLVTLFETNTIINEVLSNEKNHPYIIDKTRNDLPASISFVHYVFENKHHLKEKADFKRIPLNVIDLNENMSFQTCPDLNVFPTIGRQYRRH